MSIAGKLLGLGFSNDHVMPFKKPQVTTKAKAANNKIMNICPQTFFNKRR